jgi:hypothetical protein
MSTPNAVQPEYLRPRFLRLDLPAARAQPSWWRWVIGTGVVLLGSLLACLLLAKLVSAANPDIAGY